MKKIVILTLCLLLTLSLCGCSSTTDTQALEKLNSELNNTSSIVSSTNTSEISEVSSTLANNVGHISLIRENAYYNMINEDQIRQDVLNLSSILKSYSSNKYKLGQKNANAIVELANTLKNNTSKLSQTKKEVKTQVNRIKKFSKVNSINYPQMLSAYNSLNSLMNERQTYLINILSTLQEVDNILNENQLQTANNNNNFVKNPTQSSHNSFQNNYYDCENLNCDEETYKNCYSASNDQSYSRNNKLKTQSDKKNDNTNNIDTYKNANTKYNDNANLSTYNDKNIDSQIDNNNYGFNYYNNKYKNIEYRNSAYNRNGRINPNRNTDTFYPTRSNIDTYRYRPNFNTYNYRYNNLNRYNGFNHYNDFYNEYNQNAIVASEINDENNENNYNNKTTNIESDDKQLETLNKENQNKSLNNISSNSERKEDMLREKGINKIKSDRVGKIIQRQTRNNDKTEKKNFSSKKDNIKLDEIGMAKISNSHKNDKGKQINPLNIHQNYNNVFRFDNVTKRPIEENQPKIARDDKISKVERA